MAWSHAARLRMSAMCIRNEQTEVNMSRVPLTKSCADGARLSDRAGAGAVVRGAARLWLRRAVQPHHVQKEEEARAQTEHVCDANVASDVRRADGGASDGPARRDADEPHVPAELIVYPLTHGVDVGHLRAPRDEENGPLRAGAGRASGAAHVERDGEEAVARARRRDIFNGQRASAESRALVANDKSHVWVAVVVGRLHIGLQRGAAARLDFRMHAS